MRLFCHTISPRIFSTEAGRGEQLGPQKEMKVLWYHDISRNNEFVFQSDFLENLQGEIFAASGLQKLTTVIATAGDEVEFTTAMKSLSPLGTRAIITQAS